MKYLNELRNSLPTNCLFDKGKVGCGGTTLAIESDKPYVIAVPFQSLVENKVKQYPNERRIEEVLGVMAGTTVNDVKKYLDSVVIPKIIVTYDSLYKVTQCINPKEFNLLIDEYHILFTQYAFRSEAIKRVLREYNLYNEYCFMTATPIEEEFILNELKDLPVVTQNWDDATEINVVTIKCNSTIASTSRLIEQFLNGEIEGNAYFFLNSTKTIKKIVDNLGLTSENTRVIYSKNARIKMDIPNSTTLDEPKKINFLTSTAFEGSDIYDEDGRTFVVSDSNAEHSLLDISTTIQQIAGRIRNSKYKGELIHLYNTNRYISLDYDSFKASQEEQIKKCNKFVNIFNAQDKDYRELGATEKSLYLIKNENNFIEFDENLVKVDTFNYKVATSYTFRVSLEELYKQNNFTVLPYRDMTRMKDIALANDRPSLSFKEVIIELENSNLFVRNQLIQQYSVDFPFLPDAYNKLGLDRIKKLKYVQKDIKKELINLSNETFEEKVIKLLNYKTGVFLTSKDIKAELGTVYSTLNSKIRAKGSDIEKYYDVKETSTRIDGKKVKGFYILRPKERVSA